LAIAWELEKRRGMLKSEQEDKTGAGFRFQGRAKLNMLSLALKDKVGVVGVKRMTRFGFCVLMIAMLGVKLVSAAQSPVGKWQTVDEKSGKVTSEVEIYEQSGKLFGKIVGLTEPNDKQGKPKVCIACTGADQDKPIVGLVILRNLSLDGDRYKGGTVLDPEDGKVYPAEIWVEDGKLMVRGYSGFLYKTRTWLKA
jgi:uncharacterized protein (DUF2147 family)